MEVKVQNEPWCEMCPSVDLIVNKELVHADNELTAVALTAQCCHLDQCRAAVKRAKVLEEQALAKWWEGMRVVPCGKEEQEAVAPMPEVKPPSGKTHLDLVRELSAVDLANLLIDGACPPSPSEDCPHDDCVQCWVNWLEGSVDGDPDA